MKNLSLDEIVQFPRPGKTPREDTLAVMKFYGLPKTFPARALAEARRISREVVADGRLDLRGKFIFTCDPVTARDYDDAISIEKSARGITLGVHIADVSHYVRPGTALDREAYRRSTSIYFADRVVPMLPPELSNGVCSLVPNEDRYAFSVLMTFDAKGVMINRSFAKSIIRSQARFTYEQVLAVIQGRGGVGRREQATLLAVHELAQTLRANRFAAGALDLEIPETEVLLSEKGELTGVKMRPYDVSHQMIEECMVAANEAVAKELWTRGVKILTRFHEAPDPEKLLMLSAELRGVGIQTGDLKNQKVFAQLLQTIKRHPLYPTLAMMVLRAMKRAVYDSGRIGHFGLAKKYYAHFTSPIRRYPDLVLHRQLADYLGCASNGVVSPTRAKRPPKLVDRWARHTTRREELANEAERALVEIKRFRLMERELASRQLVDYDAVIVKCTPFGCFVEIPANGVSGLVHISLFARRYVRFNESDQSLSAPGGGRWHVGDHLRVHVARVDFDNRRIDFAPVRDKRR